MRYQTAFLAHAFAQHLPGFGLEEANEQLAEFALGGRAPYSLTGHRSKRLRLRCSRR